MQMKTEEKSVNNKNLNLNIRNPYILNFMDNIIVNKNYMTGLDIGIQLGYFVN